MALLESCQPERVPVSKSPFTTVAAPAPVGASSAAPTAPTAPSAASALRTRTCIPTTISELLCRPSGGRQPIRHYGANRLACAHGQEQERNLAQPRRGLPGLVPGRGQGGR